MPKSIVGKPISLLVPLERADEPQRIVERLLRDKPVGPYETVRLHKDGHRLDVSLTVSPIKNAAGEVVGRSVIGHDISEAKRAQSELRQSEERFRLLMDGVKDYAIYLLGSSGHVVNWNAGAERLFGYGAAEIVGKSAACFYPDASKSISQLVEDLECATTTGRHECDGWRVHKDGTQFHAHQVTTALRDAAGQLRGFTQVIHDVTELKRKTQALEDTNHRLEQTLEELHRTQQQLVRDERLRALGQMASGIAHDFNNALAPVIGFSELLLMRPESLQDTGKVKSHLEIIHESASDAAQIVRRLWDFYRYRDDQKPFGPADINQIVEQAIAAARPQWENKALAMGITIHVETELQKLPVVAGDPGELSETLVNLILNAVDAMLPLGREGWLRFRTRLDGEHVLLEVSDTGVGMDENMRQHCFEPFFTTKAEHGSGMGLASVYGTINRHGGMIAIDSAQGQGTTVLIRLPVETTKEINGFRMEVGMTAPPLRVLLVDDEPELRAVVSELLKEDGHAVEVAADGREALEKFRKGQFDLVITDKAMHPMNGEQLAAAIKGKSATTPVMMLTGFGDMMNAAGERPGNVDCVLGKPASMIELRQGIAKLCCAPTNAPKHS